MLKLFDFECPSCKAQFEGLVEDVLGQPEGCSKCSSTGPFIKLPSSINLAVVTVVDRPGAKQFKAGYQHSHNRPAELKDKQFSMFNPARK